LRIRRAIDELANGLGPAALFIILSSLLKT
jgi:hypothetical protein